MPMGDLTTVRSEEQHMRPEPETSAQASLTPETDHEEEIRLRSDRIVVAASLVMFATGCIVVPALFLTTGASVATLASLVGWIGTTIVCGLALAPRTRPLAAVLLIGNVGLALVANAAWSGGVFSGANFWLIGLPFVASVAISTRAGFLTSVFVVSSLVGLYVVGSSSVLALLHLIASITAVIGLQALAYYNARLEARLLARLRQRREALLAARRAEALGRFAGGVAHDFNNLLTIIGSYASLLRVSSNEEEFEQAVSAIDDAVTQAASLTTQLLAYGRRQVLYPEVVDAAAIVRRTRPLLERLVGEQVEVRLSIATGVAPVLIDPNQLPPILLNLAANARDAMPNGGLFELRVCCEERGGSEWVVIEAADTGIGMSPENQERAFEPFFTTKRSGRGTGLGLATAHGSVLQSHGEISIESELGRGTTIRIRLPKSQEGEVTQADPAEAPQTARVLLVEDEPLVRRIAERILARHFDVTTYESGDLALQALRAQPRHFNVVLSDIVMPGTCGSQLVHEARALGVDSAFVLMSGYTPEETPSGGLPPNCFFLAKPFDPEELVRVVQTACSLRDSGTSGYPTVRKIEIQRRRRSLVEPKEAAVASA